jgi:hypothetical protein
MGHTVAIWLPQTQVKSRYYAFLYVCMSRIEKGGKCPLFTYEKQRLEGKSRLGSNP